MRKVSLKTLACGGTDRKVSAISSSDRLKALDNISEFVRHAKYDLTTFGKCLDWDSWAWKDVGSFTKHGSKHGPRTKRVPAESLLDSDFIEFARAYVRHRHANNPHETRGQHVIRLQALRVLEFALLEVHGSADPSRTDHITLDRAVVCLTESFSGSTPSSVGNALKGIAAMLVERRIVPSIVAHWVQPLRPPKNMGIAVGSEGERVRNARLPDQKALKAIAEVFNRPLNPLDPAHSKDIYTTSLTALLLSAPSRAGDELHHLPCDLDFRASDKFGAEQMGLYWTAGKGFGRYSKWVWKGMKEPAELALARVKEMTEEARKLARWLEDPKTNSHFYRHADCPVVRDDELLTSEQVCAALGLTNHRAIVFGERRLTSKQYTYTLDQLWHLHILPRHRKEHPYFPYVSKKDAAKGEKGGLKFSDALFCMRGFQLNSANRVSPVRLWMPSLASGYSNEVGLSSESQENFFERHGYKDDHGNPLSIRSHSFRHLLNTEAQRGQMTNEQLAWWSGRVNQNQNEVYNHMSEQERVNRTKAVLADENGVVRIVPFTVQMRTLEVSVQTEKHGHWEIDKRVPVSLGELDLQPKVTSISTLYGRCEHDYALSPCEGFANCLSCSDHSCIKGSGPDEAEKLLRLHELSERVTFEVANAKARLDEGYWGAQNWLQNQTKWLEKIRQLIAILSREDVPDGSIVKTGGANNQTHLHRTLRHLAIRARDSGSMPEPVIQEMLLVIDQVRLNDIPVVTIPFAQLGETNGIGVSMDGAKDVT